MVEVRSSSRTPAASRLTRPGTGAGRRAVAAAALVAAIAATASGCGERAVVGVDDSGHPTPALVAAGREYAALLAAGNRAGLAAMASRGNVGADLRRVVAVVADCGDPVPGVGGDDANIAGIRFAVRCDARHTVRFGQTFTYAGSGWHPAFRVFPPAPGTPTVDQPEPAGELARPLCP